NIVPDLHFMGLQSQVSRLLAIADLFLLPSEREGLSLAALEAMTMGVPVVATEVGGMPELIQTGENGFLAPVGDTELMAKYATQVLKDSELRARISTAAQATANGIFHPDTIVPQYETAYYDALK
ncbi:MAG: glycosyltransferase, partial [Patescibacteria group bacterium]